MHITCAFSIAKNLMFFIRKCNYTNFHGVNSEIVSWLFCNLSLLRRFEASDVSIFTGMESFIRKNEHRLRWFIWIHFGSHYNTSLFSFFFVPNYNNIFSSFHSHLFSVVRLANTHGMYFFLHSTCTLSTQPIYFPLCYASVCLPLWCTPTKNHSWTWWICSCHFCHFYWLLCCSPLIVCWCSLVMHFFTLSFSVDVIQSVAVEFSHVK